MVFEQHQTLKLLKTFVCATGENPGTKVISGDARTPEGIYFITEIYEDKKITVFGSRAYHLDYPNVFDKHAGHLGDGIFIHGTNKMLMPYSSNGCITLANEDLEELAAYLTVDSVPIIILESLPSSLLETNLKMSINDTRFHEILDQLSFPPSSLSAKDIEALSFLTIGSQAIASISYKIYDADTVEYRYHKRAYFTAITSKKWHTLYSVEQQVIIPTLLALHPIKNGSIAEAPPLETVTVPMNIEK